MLPPTPEEARPLDGEGEQANRVPLYLGTLAYTTRWGTPDTAPFYRYDNPENGWVFVYVDTRSTLETTYTLYRVYTNPLSNADIIAGVRRPDTQTSYLEQLRASYQKESLLSDNLIGNAHMVVSDSCREYFGGTRCVVTSKGGVYGLVASTLSSSTGPYHLDASETLTGLYAIGEGRVLVQTGFGDAGASVATYAIWDTKQQTLTKVSGWMGMYRESASIVTGATQYELQWYYDESREDYRRSGLMPTDLFSDIFTYRSPVETEGDTWGALSAIATTLIPQNRTDATAPWLVVYTYGNGVASIAYEFNPLTETMTQYGDMVFH